MKLADILIRGVDETPPKVTIHLPPTPMTEAAPSLPLVKTASKPTRPPKLGSQPTQPSLAHTPGPPKLKLIKTLPKTPVLGTEQPKRSVAFTPAEPTKMKIKAHPAKPDRAGHVPKAQVGGMSLQDVKASRNALKKLRANKHAVLFLQPVDPIRDHAPK